MSYFVTGTDTNVGKTIFSAYLAKCGRAKYWKPIQCGQPFDEDRVGELIGYENVHPGLYKLRKPLSPHKAFELENQHWDMTRCITPPGDIVVEGAGGVYVPITWEYYMMDLMAQLGFPIILVARSSLGTLNHSLLSIEALRNRRLSLKSVVMVGPENESNRQSVERIAGVSVFEFPWLEDLKKWGDLNLERGRQFFWTKGSDADDLDADDEEKK